MKTNLSEGMSLESRNGREIFDHKRKQRLGHNLKEFVAIEHVFLTHFIEICARNIDIKFPGMEEITYKGYIQIFIEYMDVFIRNNEDSHGIHGCVHMDLPRFKRNSS